MSLPPYKHTRNSCLQTEDEPLIPGLAGAPLITYRCVREKRRTSDQRVARIQSMPGVEFEYEYVPTAATYTRPGSKAGALSREKMIFQHPKINPVDLESVDGQSPPGASGDQLISTVKDIAERAKRINARNNVARKPAGQRHLKDVITSAKSTCSRQSSVSPRSLVSNCSRSSQKTQSTSESKKSRNRNDHSRESLSSTLNAVLDTPGREQREFDELCFQKFGKIANGLDDDDLRLRRR